MTVDASKQRHEFQTEVRQLLHLMIHSLYSNKEIFLRELISNASDAIDKLRFEAISDEMLFDGDSELKVYVDFDKQQRTVTVRDNGIGMSHDEVIEHIGTIAKSGTRQFFDALTGDQAKDRQLIGQFGVGFYSTFIVAEKVVLETRRAGMGAEHGVRWESSGEGDYTLETIEKAARGTQVTLHLRKEEDEFLEDFRLRNIIRKYSDHISVPILMKATDKDKQDEYEEVNKASALWMRPKKEIKKSEYMEFYKHVAHDFEDPLTYVHNHVEGKQSYVSLLYLPKRAPFDMWDKERRHGIKLYVRRVFIMDDAEHLMPGYLRFVRGVIDSDDLPLNISREILQKNRVIDSIRSASIKRILGLLAKLSQDDKETYQTFWDEFGKVIKEGLAEDSTNSEQLASLLRFASTHTNSEKQDVSLSEYISRMKEGQEKIYYITGDSFAAVKSSPHLEIFRKKGVEVLLMADRVDEWSIPHLTEFEGKKLQSIAKGALDLGELEDQEDKKLSEDAEKDFKGLVERMQTALGDQVKDVRISHRLTDSPSCLVVEEHDMAISMQKLLKQAGHNLPTSQPTLEINIEHPLVVHLNKVEDEKRFSDWSHVLLDQAMLSEGGQLSDPSAFVSRLNEIMLAIMK